MKLSQSIGDHALAVCKYLAAVLFALTLLLGSLSGCSPRVIRVDAHDYVKVSNGWSRDYIRKDQLPLWEAGVPIMHYDSYVIRMPKLDKRTAGR